ncbi:hypothetical protein L6R53_12280 [Myxococcota bacterium]|nr:hypothetical protein [Myxococcota bacterium]
MRATTWSLVLLGLTATACTKKTASEPQGECATLEDCPDGKQCIDAMCVQVDCTTSAECPFNTYCDVQNYTCVDGCREDTDCLSGFSCDTVANTCVESGCTDTELDCSYGQYCDRASGSCIDDTKAHCEPCDVLGGSANQCPGGECYFLSGANCNTAADCDPGYACDNIPGYGKLCHADHCLISCNPNVDEPCPRGYACLDASGLGDYVCYADCPYLSTNGYL